MKSSRFQDPAHTPHQFSDSFPIGAAGGSDFRVTRGIQRLQILLTSMEAPSKSFRKSACVKSARTFAHAVVFLLDGFPSRLSKHGRASGTPCCSLPERVVLRATQSLAVAP